MIFICSSLSLHLKEKKILIQASITIVVQPTFSNMCYLRKYIKIIHTHTHTQTVFKQDFLKRSFNLNSASLFL